MSLEYNIPNGWEERILGECLNQIAMGPFGSNLKVSMFTKTGVPIIKGSNLLEDFVGGKFSFVSEEKADSLRKAVAFPNDLIITHRGTLGQVSLVPKNKHKRYVTSQSQLRLSVDSEKIYFRYLLYFFKSRQGQYQLLKNASQVGVPAISTPTKSVKEIELTIPKNIEEQKAIANILNSFDDKIENLHAQNKTLETTAQTIFKEWFGKYQIDDELPEGWRVGELREILEIKYGKDHKHLKDGVFPLYGSGGIMRYVEKPLYDKDSILIPRKGTLSNLFYLNQPFWSVDTMFYSRIKHSFHGRFAFLFLKSIDLSSMNVGSAVPSLTTQVLNQIPIVIPKDEIVIEFNKIVSSFYEKLDKNNSQIQALKKTRDILLPKLMSGALRVNDFKS